jgi:gamma-glutamyltranspeptidase/glutathione hydrolase
MKYLFGLALLISAISFAAQDHRRPDTASTKKGMVVTCQSPAGQIGIDILRKGGNAADAYIATTLAEYVTAFGYTSISGPIGLLYYDAKNKSSLYLNAGLNKVADSKAQFDKANPISGRSYVIGGAALGLESLYQRFGSKHLSFVELVAPSVKLARDGFSVYPSFAGSLRVRAPLFKSSPEWNKIFTKDGVPLKTGDILVQTDLANTLTHYGKEGSAYFFKGPFAAHLISYIRSHGGNLTAQDLEKYQIFWSPPLEATYKGFKVQTSSYRSYGGLELLLNLKTIEGFKDIASKAHFSKNEDVFNLVLRSHLFGIKEMIPRMKFASRIDDLDQMKELVNGPIPARLWKEAADPAIPAPYVKATGSHSCNTIVIDKDGNIATGTHTINSMPWGDYGLVVDGVSLNSAHPVASDAPPGERALDSLNPTLVFKDEKPVIAAGFFSSALHPAAFQILLNLLDYDMTPQETLDTPRFGAILFDVPSLHWSILLDDRYPKSWVKDFSDKGISFSQPSGFNDTGMGMIIRIDSKTGLRTGSPTDLLSHPVVLTE